ncbi:hypothetical protein HDV03_004818 [Kappamyces sp. JEL0829]|nr:hypothetical protein HDV03_004818 [Kappamyces sp. JEL0829]
MVLLGTALFLAAFAAADFPPDYIISRNCGAQGPLKLCVLNKNGNDPRVAITYLSSGYLWAQASPLSVWVAINGNPGKIFGKLVLNNDELGASYVVNQIRNVQKCYHATTGDNSTYAPFGYSQCPANKQFPRVAGAAETGVVDWYYDPAPDGEAEFIQQNGIYGTWNIEVAAVNDRGEWDSQYSKNYRFAL